METRGTIVGMKVRKVMDKEGILVLEEKTSREEDGKKYDGYTLVYWDYKNAKEASFFMTEESIRDEKLVDLMEKRALDRLTNK